MKNICHLLGLIILIILQTPVCQASSEHNLRQFSNKDGLSNSSILSICQDTDGLLWIGSCDGLNTFDGNKLQTYTPIDFQNKISGNLISSIVEAGRNILWIKTNYGLDRLNTKTQEIQHFEKFKDINKIAKSPKNDIYIIKDNGELFYFPQNGKCFQKVMMIKTDTKSISQMAVDKYNTLWIFFTNGDYQSFHISKRQNSVKLEPSYKFQHSKKLKFTSIDDASIILFVNQENELYEYDLSNGKTSFIINLSTEIHSRGEISSIIRHRNNYFVGFKSNGLIQIKKGQKSRYIQAINIQSGIFCLVKDLNQDIVWIGTDGQGIYMYSVNDYSIKNNILNIPPYGISNPVRALFLDGKNTLWIGTKGGGILRIFNFYSENKIYDHLQTDNTALTDNTVYCFEPSKWKILWIGTESGINYYSYKDKILKSFPLFANGKTVRFIHSICEFNDSTLWISTVEEGIVKVKFRISQNEPIVVSTRRIMQERGKRFANNFFTSLKENDSIIWFGNRGYGAFRWNTLTNQFKSFQFNQVVKSQTINDIFAIYKNKEGYWFGSSNGLIRLNREKYHIYNEADGFPNNTVHGILEDSHNNLWLSTNQGLVRFNTVTNTIQTYPQKGYLEITEFSDGAFFKDNRTNTLFFGGTNGFVSINNNNINIKSYKPSLKFYRLSIYGKEYNLFKNSTEEKGKPNLKLSYKQNFFSISFRAIDYIDGNNYVYYYKISNFSHGWIDNGSSQTATFSNLPSGKYQLWVKYKNKNTGKESLPQSITIEITPPWYTSSIAYCIYGIVVICITIFSIKWSIRRFKRKRANMIKQINQQKKEEIYESKLRFFINITHEFCTPLTLISGPCERLLSYTKADSYITKYANMIRQNAGRLNSLILEIIEFRKLETGNKVLKIEHVFVSKQLENIAEAFSEVAERRMIDYKIKIKDDIFWNTDNSCLYKITSNLISNAFKYTPDNGTITVELCTNDQNMLCIRISNSGKGILKEDIDKIFDRFQILENFESQGDQSSRNGLGLAICHSMVTLLKGQIKVTSLPQQLTTFEVLLPAMDIIENTESTITYNSMHPMPTECIDTYNKEKTYTLDIHKRTIMIIDDDASMLWFIADIFNEKYNTITFGGAKEAYEQLKMQLPDLIITDIMMPDMDGVSLIKKVKSDSMLNHIPIIALSALNNIDEQVKSIGAGAEAYITKPFDIGYLETIVNRLILRKDELKAYYNSVYSAFELANGRLLHTDDKVFFEKIMQNIDNNIQNAELSVDFLSKLMGCSTRQFYRRLKDITEKSPAEIIKEYRLSIVERYLVTTTLSIEEIMYKAGYINKGTFYKTFAQSYKMSPRQYREAKRNENTFGNLKS